MASATIEARVMSVKRIEWVRRTARSLAIVLGVWLAVSDGCYVQVQVQVQVGTGVGM